MARCYKFSVLRVCPDMARGELMNIGIIVFRAHDLDIRLLPSLRKLQSLCSESEIAGLQGLENTLNKLVTRIEGTDERYAFLSKIGAVQLSALGDMAVEDEADYQATIAQLMARYVEPVVAKHSIRHGARLHTELKKIFRGRDILGDRAEDIFDHRIVENFQISDKNPLLVDFALKNGAYHFTETVDFRVKKNIALGKLREAALSSVVLDQANKAFPGCKRYFVYAANFAQESEILPHLAVAEKYCDNIFNFESLSEKSDYVKRMLAASGRDIIEVSAVNN